jgi:AmmeMemoRadiSam system protein A
MAATHFSRFEADERAVLLETAASAIEGRLAGAADARPPDLAALPTTLAFTGTSFVSLHTRAGLRGCCGTLEPLHPLAVDVWRNAQASAFADPRFEPLAAAEWHEVTALEISVLTGFERIDVGSEAELLQSLVPGVDGLVLAWRGGRSTFLPKVWEHVADAREFLQRLKAKAGWPADFWAADMEIRRYRAVEISMEWPAARAREVRTR